MTVFCTSCGTELAEHSRFCQSCGTPVGATDEVDSSAGRRTISVSRRVMWLVLGVVFLIGGGVIAIAAWGDELVAAGESRLLLQERRLGDRSTLVLAEPGVDLSEGQVVADNVSFAYNMRIVAGEDWDPWDPRNRGRMAVTSDGLAVAYQDTEARNHVVLVSGDEVSELFDSPHPLSVSYVPESERFIVIEDTETADRCHVTDASGLADWSVLADRCVLSTAGSYLAFAERDSASNSTQIGKYGLSDDLESDLGAVSGEVAFLTVGEGGAVSAATQNVSEFNPDARGVTLFGSDGSRIYEEECVGFASTRLLDSGASPVWCTATDGVVALEIVDSNGDVIPVLEDSGHSLQVVEADGALWVVVAADSGDRLYRMAPEAWEADMLLEQDDITLRVGNDSMLSFSNAMDDPEVTVSMYDTSAQEMSTLGVVEGFPSLHQYGDNMYVSVDNLTIEEPEFSWYRVDVQAGQLVPLVVDWASVSAQNQGSDESMILVGRQVLGDDESLMAVGPDGELVKLDETPEIRAPIIVGDHVVYSTSDDPDFNRPEVRRAAVAGNGEPELLWEDVSLVGVPWISTD